MGYSHLTGQFPQMSAGGNKYIFVVYSWDANVILMEPMQNKNDNKMLRVYRHMYEKLDKVRIKPKIKIFDNEASMQVCHFITNMLNALYQNVIPPNTILLLALHPLTYISQSTNGMTFFHKQNSH